jgi:hypothetical protein
LIAYFPALRTSSKAAELYSYFLGSEVKGYEFKFNSPKLQKISESNFTCPIDKALQDGAKVLIGQSLGGYATVLAGKKLFDKKIILIDGGMECLPEDTKTITLSEALEEFSNNPESELEEIEEEIRDEIKSYGSEWGKVLGVI